MVPLEADEVHLAYDEWERFRNAEKAWKENDDNAGITFDPALYRMQRLEELDDA